MRTPGIAIASVLVLGSLTLVQPAFADEVDQLFTQGTAALEAGKHEEAFRAFQAAWKLRKTHDVAANLAQAEIQLGKHRDAAEHLAFALRSFPVTGKAVVRKQIEQMLAEEKPHVVTLTVSVDVDKAEVSVQGRPAGIAPIAEELFADAGTVTVEAGAPGYEPAKQVFEAKKGEARTVELKLVRQASRGARKELLIAGGAVAGAGIVGGAVLLGVSASVLADAKAQRDALVGAAGRQACDGPGAPAECDQVQSSLRSAQDMGNAGAALLIGAGLVGAGTLVYAFAVRPKAPPPVEVSMFVGPHGANAALRWSF